MASKKISELIDAGVITGAELMPVVQGGVTLKTTIDDLLDRDITTQKINGMNFQIAGLYSTAIGEDAMPALDPTAQSNDAIGFNCMHATTIGSFNSIVGKNAMAHNTEGSYNSGIGNGCLYNNTTGVRNTGVGCHVLMQNTTGGSNVAVGEDCMRSNTTGGLNVAVGQYSLYAGNGNYNVVVGARSGETLTTAQKNTFIGYRSGYNPGQKVDADNTIAIGNESYTTANNQAVIGNASLAEVYLGSVSGAAKLICSKPRFTAIPTSADGLAAGDVWSNGGVLTIVS